MSALAGKSALVTGATGFIGGAVARRLREVGVRVHCTSRRAQPEPGPWASWSVVDLVSIAEVRRLLAAVKPDLVFHLAGLTSATRGLDGVLPVFHANLVPTVNVLAAVAEHGVERLLLPGSLEEPPPDGAWPVASSPYAASKLASGAYMRMFHALYGTPAVWLRLFMVYGPGQSDLRKLIPHVTCSLLRGEAPALTDGRRLVDWIYIDDVVDAFLRAAARRDLDGQTLDVGSGRLVAVRDVVERLVDIIAPAARPRFGSLPERPLEQTRVADAAETLDRLGWRATTSLQEGLRRTVAWYREALAPPETPAELRRVEG